MVAPSFDPGSWRDRDARVFTYDGRIYRALSERAQHEWSLYRRSRAFERAAARGALVDTTEVPSGQVPLPPGSWSAVLCHRTLPFVSYPYEWTFCMLRDAALLQLDLLLEALDEGLVLKDGTAFNVQWIGTTPTFIDLSSFTTLRPGEPWAGYRQFCCQCLNPLLLQAHTGVSFRPWLRGSLEGIEPGELAGLLSFRDLLRRGVFAHVYLHAKFQQRYAAANVRASLKDSGLGPAVVQSTVRSLRRLVAGLSSAEQASPWVDYAHRNSYGADGHAQKRAFVEQVIADRVRALVWDMGANTGEYSRLAASNSRYVIAFDGDEAAVDRHYQILKRDGPANILPLVVNAVNPSPGQGWRSEERKSLVSRGRPELVLCLALAHHLVLGANIPVSELIDYLAELTDEIVVEFVDRCDPMAQRLLLNREDVFADYTRANFEAALGRAFHIERAEELSAGTRVLYHASRAARAA